MLEEAERKIILIGYRCTGKTVIGRQLAARLGLPFIDTDALVEANAGQTIREMIAAKGWDVFRENEREAIQGLAALGKCVIATGGGAVLDERTAAFLKNEGVLIWLKAGEETIYQRLRDDAVTVDQRPALSSYGLRKEIAALLTAREPVYSRLADIAIDTDADGIEECVAKILNLLTEAGLTLS